MFVFLVGMSKKLVHEMWWFAAAITLKAGVLQIISRHNPVNTWYLAALPKNKVYTLELQGRNDLCLGACLKPNVE